MPRAKKSEQEIKKVKKTVQRKTASVSSVVQKTETKKAESIPQNGLGIDVFDIQGRKTSTMTMPEEIFGQKPNLKLLTQALHIYLVNQKKKTAHTKTRGEVRGGGVKPWRQKGTGRARAGSIRSPLWVGGGTTFGPRYREVRLSLPQKMRHQALISALSDKFQSGNIKVVSNIEKVEPKTKIVAELLSKLDVSGSTLFVISREAQNKGENIKRASRNIQKVSIEVPQNLNAYQVTKIRTIIFSKDAVGELK